MRVADILPELRAFSAYFTHFRHCFTLYLTFEEYFITYSLNKSKSLPEALRIQVDCTGVIFLKQSQKRPVNLPQLILGTKIAVKILLP
jgi:hypothetical protein